MIFVADENVDQSIVDRLRLDGHEVLSVAELDPSIPDDSVLSLARDRQCLLLTADKDFGELVYRQRQVNSGIVLLRLEGLSPSRKAFVVSNAILDHESELQGAFTVITPGLVRIRSRI